MSGSQTRTALVSDASARGVLDGSTSVLPLWTRHRLWRSDCNGISTVRSPPACVTSSLSGLGRWLGQNSKTNKLSRQLGDIQIRMRLKVSGDKSEIRQMYIPALFPHIIKPLTDDGAVSALFAIVLLEQILMALLCRVQSMMSSSVWMSISCRKKTGTPSSSWVLAIIRTIL